MQRWDPTYPNLEVLYAAVI